MWRSNLESIELRDFPAFLDDILRLADGIDGIMVAWYRLRQGLNALHASATTPDWQVACAQLRAHPFHAMAMQDPFTRHAAVKPRGYPGDAALLDHVYRLGAAPAEVRAASPVGRNINAVTTELSFPVAVRERYRLVARLVDATAHRCRGGGAEILALTGGHLREASLAHAPAEGTLRRWISLDQDPASADEAARSHAHLPCVVPICAPVGPLMTRPLLHGRFDLIYAANLFGYLDAQTAAGLLGAMLHALKPGGQALIASPSNGLADSAYYEALQDWQIIQRDHTAMQALLDTLPEEGIAARRVLPGANGHMLYGLVTKVA